MRPGPTLRQGLYNLDDLPNSMPSRVAVCDVTLREGEQTPGVRLPLSVKLDLAERLDAIGVAQIQLNHVTHHGVEAEAAALRRLNLTARLEIMTSANRPDWRDAVNRAIDAGTDIFHTNIAASPHVRHMYPPLDDDALCARMFDAVALAAGRGASEISVTFVDAPRVPPVLLDRLVDAALEAGATRLRAPDSVGVATPRGMAALTRRIRERAARKGRSPVLGAHCHNDYGCAAANTLACVEEGATLVDLACNGLGERAGNADLATVATVLETVHDCRTGIRLEGLTDLAHRVAVASGSLLPACAPMTGDTVFADLEGIHMTAQRRDPFAFQGFLPELVGNRRRVLLGIFASPEAVGARLDALGVAYEVDRLGDMAAEIRSMARASAGGLVDDDALRRMAERAGLSTDTPEA